MFKLDKRRRRRPHRHATAPRNLEVDRPTPRATGCHRCGTAGTCEQCESLTELVDRLDFGEQGARLPLDLPF